MTAIERLLLLAQLHREAAGLSTTQLSWRLFGDSKKLDALARGADITVRRYEDALTWFSDHWSTDIAWPESIARPPRISAPAPASRTEALSA